MADVAVAAQEITRSGSGLTPAYTGSLSTSNTYLIPNDGQTFLHVKKSGASDCVVTVAAVKDGETDLTATVVASTGDKMIGPISKRIYSRQLSVTFSNITGLTIAAVRLP